MHAARRSVACPRVQAAIELPAGRSLPPLPTTPRSRGSLRRRKPARRHMPSPRSVCTTLWLIVRASHCHPIRLPRGHQMRPPPTSRACPPQLASTPTAFSRASRCPARDALPDQGAGQRTPCWLVGGVVREGAVEYSARWSASDAATAAAAQRFVATTEYLSLWKRRDLANLG